MQYVLQGYRTTNTDNVARRCFQNPDVFAKAVEIDVKLVSNIATILSAFKCKKLLKLDKFQEFC